MTSGFKRLQHRDPNGKRVDPGSAGGPRREPEGRHPGQKQRALLAILLTHANDVVSPDALIDDLWPDEPPPFVHECARLARPISDPAGIAKKGSGRANLAVPFPIMANRLRLSLSHPINARAMLR